MWYFALIWHFSLPISNNFHAGLLPAQGQLSVGPEQLVAALSSLPALTLLDLQYEGSGCFTAAGPLLHACTQLEVRGLSCGQRRGLRTYRRTCMSK